jgi:inner membrane protein
MDSLTHIVIGAAIGDLMLGKQIGRKAAVIGALAKTIPDFDLFYTGLSDPFMYMCHHRGHTHSLLWESLYAFPLAYLFYRMFSKNIPYLKWFSLFIICLWGHSLLDTCTNYGTRLFLPFTNNAYSINSMAIADMFFTLPIFIMLIIALIFKNQSTARLKWMRGLLVYCFIYLAYTFGNKVYANNLFTDSLKENNIAYSQSMTNPTILNNFLWYGIAYNDSTLYISENSLLFPKKKVEWIAYKRNKELLEKYENKEKSETLQWFSKGYDISEQNGDTLNVYCVKFGRMNMEERETNKAFGFYYKLYYENGVSKMKTQEPKLNKNEFKKAFGDLYKRIMGK